MEIGNLSTTDESNEGKWFVAELYGKRQPFAINILGADSDRVRNHQRKSVKKILKEQKNSSKLSDDQIDELLDAGDDEVIVRMNGLCSVKLGKGEAYELLPDEPLTMNGVTLTNDEPSYRALIEAIPAVKEFVNAKSKERSNFLHDGKKN